MSNTDITTKAVSESTLTIGDPFVHTSAPSSLQFDRRRRVDIDWLDYIDGNVAEQVREPAGRASIKLGTLEYIAEGWRRSNIDTKAPLKKGETWDFKDVYLDATENRKAVFLILKTDSKNRLYLPLKEGGGVFEEAELPAAATLDDLDTLFDSKAVAWQLTSEQGNDVPSLAQQIEILDMAARDLLERYQRAHELEELYDKLLKNGPTIDANLWTDDSKLADIRKKVVQFSGQRGLARAEKLRLSSEANERGYVLPLEDITITRPDNNEKITYTKGRLYVERITQVTWEVTETRTEYQYESGACGGSATPVQVPVKVAKAASMLVYEELTLGQDPVIKARERLSKLNFNVYEAFQEERGWVLADGTPLEMLIARCSRNEEVRLHSAVILHFQSTNPLVVFPEHTALVVKRPLPGVSPIVFPSVSLRESLTYNVLWKGTELGPLVGSVNLAPGEERTIATTRTVSEEISSVAARKSLLEEANSSSQDFSTELEREFNNEMSKTNTSTTKIGLNAVIGPVGGNLDQTNSSSTTIKSTAKELSRIARKTAQSFNRKVQSETSVTTTEKSSVQQTDSSTASVKNTNPGRTLNLLIYQINNLFSGGVFLNDIRITVTEPIELIANTGIFASRTVRLHELEKVGQLLDPSRLPLEPNPQVLKDPLNNYWKPLIRTFLETIQDEYGDETFPTRKRDAKKPDYASRSASVLRLDTTALIGKQSSDFVADEDTPAELLRKLESVLQSVIIKPAPIVSELLSVASGAFYLDGRIGVTPLLEPYAEGMRKLEAARLQAEVNLLRMRALRFGSAFQNFVVKAVADGKAISFQLRFAPRARTKLHVLFDEQEIGAVAVDTTRASYSIAWDQSAPEDELQRRLAFYDESDQSFMPFIPTATT